MNVRTANNSASVQQFDIAVVPRTPLKASYIALAIALLSPSSVCVEESNRMSVLFWKDTNTKKHGEVNKSSIPLNNEGKTDIPVEIGRTLTKIWHCLIRIGARGWKQYGWRVRHRKVVRGSISELPLNKRSIALSPMTESTAAS